MILICLLLFYVSLLYAKSEHMLQKIAELLCLKWWESLQFIEIVQFMSLSSHQEEQRKEGSILQERPEEMFEEPLIVLSSSSSELSPEPQQNSLYQDPFEETIVQRRRDSEHEKLKRLSSIKNMWDQEEEKEKRAKRELEDIRNNPPRKQNSNLNKQKEQLLKEFDSHRYLPIQSLEFVKERLDNFAAHPKCQFENKDNLSEQQVKARQNNRQNLARMILLARQEIKLLKENRTQFQDKICGGGIDALRFAYALASNIQTNCFKKLSNKGKNKKREGYGHQIKLIIRLVFKDKNNNEFRRRILSNKYDIADLIQADEEALMSAKAKQERDQQVKQIIRQSEKTVEKPVINIDEQIIQAPIQSLKAIASLKSTSEFYEEKAEPVEERRKREKEDLIGKNKIICKKTYSEITKAMKSMQERIQRLRRHPIDKNILERLKFDLNLNL